MKGEATVDRYANASLASAATREKRPQPRVIEIATVALVLVVVGGIFLSSYYPRKVSFIIPGSLATASVALVLLNAAVVIRSGYFRHRIFLNVLKWSLLAYVVIAGMLEFVFVFDGTTGNALLILSAMLLVFALDVPTIIAFTVAKYAAD